MEGKLQTRAIVLLLLSLGGLLVDSSDEPAYDYIDRSGSILEHKAEFYKIFAKLVEAKGSENPEETAEFLREFARSVKISAEDTPIKDKYNFYQYGLKENPHDLALIMPLIVEPMNEITGELSIDQSYPTSLNAYLDTIESVFGADVNAFVNEQSNHDTKLHAFLLHYGKRLAQFGLHIDLFKSESSSTVAELFMDKLVSLSSTSKDERQIINKAREFDLMTTKLPVIKILKAIVKDYSVPIVGRIMKRERILEEARTQLHEEIRETCHGIRLEYGRLLNLYNFGRLLAPHEAAKLSPSTGFEKLNEYHRICSPIYNPYKATGNEHPSSIEEVRATLYANMYW